MTPKIPPRVAPINMRPRSAPTSIWIMSACAGSTCSMKARTCRSRVLPTSCGSCETAPGLVMTAPPRGAATIHRGPSELALGRSRRAIKLTAT